MSMVLEREKQGIREKLLERLLSLTKEEIKRRSKNVENKLSELSIYRAAKVIMAYYPLQGEVDILDKIRKDIGSKRFCFPVMDLKAKNLRIFESANLDEDFVLGPWAVMQPDTKKTKEVDIKEIDMVIVPGLAFDKQRNRLGRGAGFYDRFLRNITPLTKKVGLAFKFQILENLPTNLSHDQKVDTIVSEDSVI
ncbi:MAG: 5-formyltetrahydrofolate cyclo-ligase [Candidatus Omnitrophica bacterium]|nr:5-formyltetrahydrofolate cyclo-ligase [Candidatus Omnitrophota bacterium]